MTPRAANQWRAFAIVVRVIGFLGCVAIFTSSMFLIAYFSDKRPERLGRRTAFSGLAFWFIPSFGLILLGEAIKAYNLNDYSGYRGRLRL